jgi:hypothetical protein
MILVLGWWVTSYPEFGWTRSKAVNFVMSAILKLLACYFVIFVIDLIKFEIRNEIDGRHYCVLSTNDTLKKPHDSGTVVCRTGFETSSRPEAIHSFLSTHGSHRYT